MITGKDNEILIENGLDELGYLGLFVHVDLNTNVPFGQVDRVMAKEIVHHLLSVFDINLTELYT